MAQDDDTPRERPRRHQTQTERDLEGLAALRERANAPAKGVPAVFDPDRTPVPGDPWEAIGRLWILRHLPDQVTELLDRVVKVELRAEKIEDLAGSVDELRQTREEMLKHVVDIKGESGSNGKLGELRRRVDVWTSRAWKLFAALVGALGSAAILALSIERSFTSLEDRVTADTARIEQLEADRTAHAKDEIELVTLSTQLQVLESSLSHQAPPPAPENHNGRHRP